MSTKQQHPVPVPVVWRPRPPRWVWSLLVATTFATLLVAGVEDCRAKDRRIASRVCEALHGRVIDYATDHSMNVDNVTCATQDGLRIVRLQSGTADEVQP